MGIEFPVQDWFRPRASQMQGWAVLLSKDLVATARRGCDESSSQLPSKDTAALSLVAENRGEGVIRRGPG